MCKIETLSYTVGQAEHSPIQWVRQNTLLYSGSGRTLSYTVGQVEHSNTLLYSGSGRTRKNISLMDNAASDGRKTGACNITKLYNNIMMEDNVKKGTILNFGNLQRVFGLSLYKQ